MKWHWIAKEEESTNLKFLRGKFPLRASLYSSMTYHISLIKTPKSYFSQRNRISLASPVFLQHPFRMNIDWSPSRHSQFGVAVVSYFPPTLLFSFLFFSFFFFFFMIWGLKDLISNLMMANGRRIPWILNFFSTWNKFTFKRQLFQTGN